MDKKSKYLIKIFLIYLPIFFILSGLIHELFHYAVGEMLVGEVSLYFPFLESGDGLVSLTVSYESGVGVWRVIAFRFAGGFGASLVFLLLARISTRPAIKSASMFIFFFHFPYAFAETIEEGSVPSSSPFFWLVLVSVGVFGGLYCYFRMQDLD